MRLPGLLRHQPDRLTRAIDDSGPTVVRLPDLLEQVHERAGAGYDVEAGAVRLTERMRRQQAPGGGVTR